MSLNYVYRDEYLVVINKPAGLLVHPSKVDRHESHNLLQQLREEVGSRVYPVHRLDKPTSGLIIFALSSEVAQSLQMLFQNKEIRKTYIAVLRGYLPEEGRVDYPLKPVAMFKSDTELLQEAERQEALTLYKCLAKLSLPISDGRFETSRYSCALLRPITGRTHQLRRHMKHISHPIVGDVRYGKGLHKRIFKQAFDIERLLLHALELVFVHPLTEQYLSLKAYPETSFEQLVKNSFSINEADISEALKSMPGK